MLYFHVWISSASVRTRLYKKAGDGKTDDLPSPVMILGTSGQRSCNSRTRFLNLADRIPELSGQTGIS